MKKLKRAAIVAAIVAVVAVAAAAALYAASQFFVSQEQAVRASWSFSTGEVLGVDEALGIELCESGLQADMPILQLVPQEIDTESFTYYDTALQDRLAQMLDKLKAGDIAWSAETPLAVLNPYGTGSNGLYLYFTTELPTQVSYTIHVEDSDIPDYTATAANTDGSLFSKTHELQLIGLVPGQTNTVTLSVVGSWGTVRQLVTFSVEMPDTQSGYPTRLETTDGESTESLSDGLYVMGRTNGYLGYAFLFDNDGVLRYEMVLEGYGADRLLWVDDQLLTSVSANKLACINALGQVTAVYELGDYALHHDMVLGEDGTVLALAEQTGSTNVEDLVIQIDLETGEVTELLDFKQVLADYYTTETRPVAVTDDFFWQAGEEDWIHLNTIQYLPESDSIIVSSRETSAIIKVAQAHTDPQVDWLIGDPAFWADTAYADKVLSAEGDFVCQYGQHSVEYAGAGEEEGVYYLRLYNNNYWSLNTRDYTPTLAASVGTELYGDSNDESQVYFYRVDENTRTYTLVSSFTVPYSSIVSNVTPAAGTENWVVNSGMANVYGEYDSTGTLIRQFAYTCTMQGYRTFKETFAGFWFAD